MCNRLRTALGSRRLAWRGDSGKWKALQEKGCRGVRHLYSVLFQILLLPMLIPGPQPGPTPTPPPGTDSGPAQIQSFFHNLYQDLLIFAVAFSTFFFAWAAIQFAASGSTGNERSRQHAQTALYLALVGLVLVLLAGVIAGIVNAAVSGQ